MILTSSSDEKLEKLIKLYGNNKFLKEAYSPEYAEYSRSHRLILEDYPERGNDVLKDLYAKIKIRHPHVFSDLELKNAEEVEQNWGKMKNDSNVNLANNNKDIPKYLPSLSLALKLQKKMPPKDINQSYSLIDKILSNKHELNSETIGKLLFEIVNIARIQDIDPEKSLRKHNNYVNKN